MSTVTLHRCPELVEATTWTRLFPIIDLVEPEPEDPHPFWD